MLKYRPGQQYCADWLAMRASRSKFYTKSGGGGKGRGKPTTAFDLPQSLDPMKSVKKGHGRETDMGS